MSQGQIMSLKNTNGLLLEQAIPNHSKRKAYFGGGVVLPLPFLLFLPPL